MRIIRRRRAMTLIEIVISLALTTLIAALIGGIMRWYVLNQTRADHTFEELRMARAVLTMVSDDLRCTLRNEPFDIQPLVTLLQSSSGAGGGGGGGGGASAGGGAAGGSGGGGAGGNTGGGGNGGGGTGGGGGGATGGGAGGGNQGGAGGGATGGGGAGGGGGTGGGGGAGGASGGGVGGGASGMSGSLSSLGSMGSGASAGGASGGSSGASSTDTTTSTTSSLPPGIYASAAILEIDVSRVPRVDEAIIQQPNIMSGTLNDLPTDIKTVSYYIQGSSMNGVQDSLAMLSSDVINSDTSNASYNGGLVRRIIARDVLQKAYTDGRSTLITRTGSLISKDVVGLQFQFYDGTKWYTTWDSSSQGLPRVVRITVAMQNPSTPLAQRMTPPLNMNSISGLNLKQSGITVYSTIVTIPGSALASSPSGSSSSGADTASSAMGLK